MMRAPRLKWHQLRRRCSDPVFLRANLEAALQAGAACEVDLVATADGHFLCLHDLTLDAETTGTGPVAALDRIEIERLRQRAPDGRPLAEAPLFLDEVVAAVRRRGAVPPGSVQLDVKLAEPDLTPPLLATLPLVLGHDTACFTAGGYDWTAICRLAQAAPGLRRGFDPLEFHEQTPPRNAPEFRDLAELTLSTAPDAAIYYLHAEMVLEGLDVGVNMVERLRSRGAEVDCWTIDADEPNVTMVLHRLIAAGCDQITTNDPEALATIIAEIATCS